MELNKYKVDQFESSTLDQNSILMIDDSKEMLQIGRIIFENDNFHVFTASSGKQGLEILSRIKPPSLILLDLNMEDMDGTKFLQKIEKKRINNKKNPPVVFYSAADFPPTKSSAIGFIKKTGNIEELLRDVHFFIDREKIKNSERKRKRNLK